MGKDVCATIIRGDKNAIGSEELADGSIKCHRRQVLKERWDEWVSYRMRKLEQKDLASCYSITRHGGMCMPKSV